MSIAERRLRDREARRQLITSTARSLAEQEGWDAVTTRRLSAEIEYSQPVLYKHFASMEDIVEAVALEGFGELAEILSAAQREGGAPGEALGRVAHAFSDFATENPPLYDAMSPVPPVCDSVPRTPPSRCRRGSPSCVRQSPPLSAGQTSTPSPRCCGPPCTD